MRKLLQIACLMLLAGPAWSAVAFVNSATANPGSGSTFNITHSPTNGNFEGICVATKTTSSTVTSVTDNGSGGGSTYLFRNAVNNGTNERVEIWSTTPTGVTGSPTSITVTLSVASVVVGIAGQYSGVNSFGRSSTFTGSSTTPTDAERMTDANDITSLCASANGTGTFSANTGNLRNSVVGTTVGGALNDNTVATNLTNITNTATLTPTNTWAVASLELKAATFAAGGSFVQGADGSSATAGMSNNTFSLVLPNAVTAGNLLVVTGFWNSLTTTITVSDQKGNTWASAVGPRNSTTNSIQLQFAFNVAAGATTITITPSAGAAFGLFAMEYSGQKSSATPLDKTASAGGTGTALDSGATATTTQPNELLIAFCLDDTGTNTLSLGASYTRRMNDTAWTRTMVEDQSVTSTGAFHGTATSNNSDNWAALVATFINASQGGGGFDKQRRLELIDQ